MCSCKKTQCRLGGKCGCRKNEKACTETCQCIDCTNVTTPPTSPISTPKSAEPPKSVIRDAPLMTPLVVSSWNMCNFCAIQENFDHKTKTDNGITRPWTSMEKDQLLWDAEQSFRILGRSADILVLQEFPFNESQVKQILEWLPADEFEYAISEAQDALEHVFIWRTSRIRPYKPIVDKWVRPLIKLKRPAGTMRLWDIQEENILILTSIHLKSGGGLETKQEYKEVFDQYFLAMHKRYGSTPQPMHVVAGDVNLNPHVAGSRPDGWHVTGSSRTVTSVGGKGYDFFFVDETSMKTYRAEQHTLHQQRPKNSTRSWIGTSDHHPIMLMIYKS